MPGHQRRYLFEDDFATPGERRQASRLAQAAPEPEVIAPSFTADELAEARAEGVLEGRAAGAAEARAAIEARIAGALETIAARLGDASAEAGRAAERAAGALAATTLDLVARALPEAAARHAQQGCAELAEALLARLSGVDRITIRLPPELARQLGPRLAEAAAASDFAGRLDVLPTDGMVAGEMRISWPGGEARRDPKALEQAAREVLRQLGLAANETDAEQEVGDGN
jgi:flagellar assembly protein FliH